MFYRSICLSLLRSWWRFPDLKAEFSISSVNIYVTLTSSKTVCRTKDQLPQFLFHCICPFTFMAICPKRPTFILHFICQQKVPVILRSSKIVSRPNGYFLISSVNISVSYSQQDCLQANRPTFILSYFTCHSICHFYVQQDCVAYFICQFTDYCCRHWVSH